MGYKNRSDMHMHTDNSPDAEHSATLMCEYAVAAELRAVAVTDHCEMDCFLSEGYDRAVLQSYVDAVKARAVFCGKLTVLSGVELGQPMHDRASSERLLRGYNFDIVLASVHNLAGMEDFYFLDFTLPENDPDVLLARYFDEILDMVRWNKFDVLSHLTYPLRYICGRDGVAVDLSRYRAVTDEILATLAKNGKALEINVSGLRTDYGRALPELDMIKRFRRLGGKYVTVGGDCHRCFDLGKNIDDGMDMAKAAGFDTVTLFDKRVPISVEIK